MMIRGDLHAELSHCFTFLDKVQSAGVRCADHTPSALRETLFAQPPIFSDLSTAEGFSCEGGGERSDAEGGRRATDELERSIERLLCWESFSPEKQHTDLHGDPGSRSNNETLNLKNIRPRSNSDFESHCSSDEDDSSADELDEQPGDRIKLKTKSSSILQWVNEQVDVSPEDANAVSEDVVQAVQDNRASSVACKPLKRSVDLIELYFDNNDVDEVNDEVKKNGNCEKYDEDEEGVDEDKDVAYASIFGDSDAQYDTDAVSVVDSNSDTDEVFIEIVEPLLLNLSIEEDVTSCGNCDVNLHAYDDCTAVRDELSYVLKLNEREKEENAPTYSETKAAITRTGLVSEVERFRAQEHNSCSVGVARSEIVPRRIRLENRDEEQVERVNGVHFQLERTRAELSANLINNLRQSLEAASDLVQSIRDQSRSLRQAFERCSVKGGSTKSHRALQSNLSADVDLDLSSGVDSADEFESDFSSCENMGNKLTRKARRKNKYKLEEVSDASNSRDSERERGNEVASTGEYRQSINKVASRASVGADNRDDSAECRANSVEHRAISEDNRPVIVNSAVDQEDREACNDDRNDANFYAFADHLSATTLQLGLKQYQALQASKQHDADYESTREKEPTIRNDVSIVVTVVSDVCNDVEEPFGENDVDGSVKVGSGDVSIDVESGDVSIDVGSGDVSIDVGSGDVSIDFGSTGGNMDVVNDESGDVDLFRPNSREEYAHHLSDGIFADALVSFFASRTDDPDGDDGGGAGERDWIDVLVQWATVSRFDKPLMMGMSDETTIKKVREKLSTARSANSSIGTLLGWFERR